VAGTGGDTGTGGTGGTGVAMCGRINCDCTYQGRNLWGNVTYVANSFDIHDFDVELTTNQSDSDLKVQEIATTGIANMCGQWKIVTATSSPPPLRVYRYTTPMAQTDFKIRTVTFQPGVEKPPSN
jgi:hypothetical protein